MASSRHQSEWKHLKGLQVQDWDDVPGTDFSPSAARRPPHGARQGKRHSGDDGMGSDVGGARRRQRLDNGNGLGA